MSEMIQWMSDLLDGLESDWKESFPAGRLPDSIYAQVYDLKRSYDKLKNLAKEQAESSIDETDLRIDIYRTGSVFNPCNAVRITHIPTGATTTWSEERSVYQNKKKALKLLREKLADISLKGKLAGTLEHVDD